MEWPSALPKGPHAASAHAVKAAAATLQQMTSRGAKEEEEEAKQKAFCGMLEILRDPVGARSGEMWTFTGTNCEDASSGASGTTFMIRHPSYAAQADWSGLIRSISCMAEWHVPNNPLTNLIVIIVL